jgi:hypothetical protein
MYIITPWQRICLSQEGQLQPQGLLLVRETQRFLKVYDLQNFVVSYKYPSSYYEGLNESSNRPTLDPSIENLWE